MKMTTKAGVLAINGGSSSIKFSLFDAANSMQRVLEGKIERIGLPGTTLTIANSPGIPPRKVAAADHAAAADSVVQVLSEYAHGSTLQAIGHRVVHGGSQYQAPQKVSPAMLEDLRGLSPFDPDHLPAEIALIESFSRHFPVLPQVACFDTAFHHALPRVAQQLPIPRRYQARGVRRYGFHGLSYQYLMQELERIAGADVANDRIILAHLGNGASMAAVHEKRSIDTTMGFTPAAGIVMGTRSGDLDPGLVAYLARSENMNAAQFDHMVNHESGLLGLSETSPDMRDLLAREAADTRAAEAIELFCYQARKTIGAYCAALGGLDTLVFSGGIGEHAAVVRSRICAGLGFLGIELDDSRNHANAQLISAAGGHVAVRVIHTDEERVIAASVCQVLDIATTGKEK
jgi:acetate kinase